MEEMPMLCGSPFRRNSSSPKTCVHSCALLELLNDAVFPTRALAGHVSSAYHGALHAH